MTDQAQNVETPHVRIHVSFDPPEGNMAGESMHALRISDGPGPDTGIYKIDNVPFFAELRLHDIVICEENVWDEKHQYTRIPEIVEVHTPSPRRTVLVMFVDDISDDERRSIIKTLRTDHGCAIEGFQPTAYAIALPGDAQANARALQFLELAHRDKRLDYEADERPA